MKSLAKLFLVCAAGASLPAHAQYKCVVKGQTVYSDHPCAVDAKHVGSAQDRVTDEQLRQRLQQSIKERRARNAIEEREAAEDAERERVQEDRRAQAAERAEAEKKDRNRRCEQAQRDLRSNDQARARYQDFGWQNSLRQREVEAKALRETIDRDCRK